MAYRGRVLVEMSTKLEGKVDKAVDSIPSDDILVVQVIFFCQEMQKGNTKKF